MKKLMIALAATALAVSANAAASIQWNVTKAIYDGTGATTTMKVDDGTVAYLFMASSDAASQEGYSTLTRSALINALETSSFANIVSAYAVGNSLELTGGKNATYNEASTQLRGSGAGDNNYYYIALMDDEGRLFMSGEKSTGIQSADPTKLSFAPTAAQTKLTQDAAWFANSDNAAQAGWYEFAEPVPEPFSGSLALLGLGAIALRRKMKKAKKA